MILPIVGYGNPVLKKVSDEIAPDYPELKTFIQDMWETMYNGKGVGLAAPQVGIDIRIFVMDSEQLVKENEDMEEDDEKYKITRGIKRVFINPTILNETGDAWVYEEGCLSIPDIRVKISRTEFVEISYFNENFEEQTERFDGMNARIIQHEYDHLQGILITDRVSPLKKSLLKGKLENIRKGKVDVKYRMRFAASK
ncbi:MAG: peptide deformylase [Chitinophagales bacterium]|nr:peptide deformylase [Saprospiraceae bacterium]MBK8680627.1 peptide deformylase [Bacteroidota bacterium]MBP7399713.1 peptide deformylase [Chitinophagales bacterium]MBP8754371.1 peptide deformylase [Chitinophagales bacterium]MBP9190248.1 peptide deformylase [Chitinophagales bacterium]